MTIGNGSHLTAVLGPTNTGKTHLAIERMLAHATGMIGFPLRLLARENYEKVAQASSTLRRRQLLKYLQSVFATFITLMLNLVIEHFLP